MTTIEQPNGIKAPNITPVYMNTEWKFLPVTAAAQVMTNYNIRCGTRDASNKSLIWHMTFREHELKSYDTNPPTDFMKEVINSAMEYWNKNPETRIPEILTDENGNDFCLICKHRECKRARAYYRVHYPMGISLCIPKE